MTKSFSLYAIALTALLILPINANAGGSDNFLLSVYTCSEFTSGKDKAGDNCVETNEEKLDVMRSIDDDGGDGGDD